MHYLSMKPRKTLLITGANGFVGKAAVEKALREIHSMLSKEQREKIAYLIRTGELLI